MKMLRQHRACALAVLAFRREWPNGAEVNATNVTRAIELGLDLNWATCLMDATARGAYHDATVAAWGAYKEACAAAVRARNEAFAIADRAYKEEHTITKRAYNGVIVSVENTHQDRRAAAWRAHKEAVVTAWVAAILDS